MEQKIRRVATYERTSSEDQRERETIRTQTDILDRALAADPNVVVVYRFRDDGVSGTIPMGQRPDGRKLIAAAAAGAFDELWVTRPDRLTRKAADGLQLYELFSSLGIQLVGILEAIGDETMFGFQSVMADAYRRQFLANSAKGMERAAREGRYCGGIRPYGYVVLGRKEKAYLVPSDIVVWGGLTEADIVRTIYYHLEVDGWSCRRIALEFNALGIPTAYVKDGRGVRGKKTQGLWRPGRVRNLVTNPVYMGDQQYGRRSKQRSRDVVHPEHPTPALVSPETWQAAQNTLARYRVIPNGGVPRTYWLRSVITCSGCGLRYCGVNGRPGVHWFRCNGQLKERGPIDGRCPSKAIRGDWLEAEVWEPIERWLRDPGAIIADIDVARDREAQALVAAADRTTLEQALADLAAARERAIDFGIRGRITEAQMDEKVRELDAEAAAITERLDAIRAAERGAEEPDIAPDYLAEIRSRLDAGLDMETRQKLVQILCRVIVETTIQDNGKKVANVIVNYRLPDVTDNLGVACDRTGTRSWRLPIGQRMFFIWLLGPLGHARDTTISLRLDSALLLARLLQLHVGSPPSCLLS
jgi:site-specific DNA recombinase